MLTYEEARNVGINACLDRIGRDFVKKYRDSSCSAYGDIDREYVYCFVGVSDRPRKKRNEGDPIVLSSAPEDQFPYMASCLVNYSDGEIEFKKCILP